MTSSRLIPLTKWHEYHPWPSTSQLRHLVFEAELNGFDRCLRRVGRKILIIESEFFAWVEEVNQRGGCLNER